jgi:hypothetical protein
MSMAASTRTRSDSPVLAEQRDIEEQGIELRPGLEITLYTNDELVDGRPAGWLWMPSSRRLRAMVSSRGRRRILRDTNHGEDNCDSYASTPGKSLIWFVDDGV